MAKEICGEGFLEVRKTRRVIDFSATVLSEIVFLFVCCFFFAVLIREKCTLLVPFSKAEFIATSTL